MKNRIIDHITIRAGDLVPHPLNYRRHPDEQREALAASYEELGFARSLLGYRLPDGRIQLIDGHLRAEFDPNALVTVEIVDVSDDEARKLMLTLDPLAALAETDAQVAAELAKLVETDSAALANLWKQVAGDQAKSEQELDHGQEPPPPEQYLILLTCRSEEHQTELLERFENEGLSCKALIQ